MSTSFFTNRDLFNFKTGDRPSQNDFKNLILNLQTGVIPGEYKLINKNLNFSDTKWAQIIPVNISTLSGSYSPYIFGNTFVNIASSMTYNKLGLYEIIGPIGTYYGGDLYSNLGRGFVNLSFNEKYNYLNNLNAFSIKKDSLTGIEASSQIPFSIVNVISSISLSFNDVYSPYYYFIYGNFSYRPTFDQSFYVNDKRYLFNAIYDDYKLDQIQSYVETENNVVSCFQALPNYVLPNNLSFNIARLFFNLNEYDSYIRIYNLVNSLSVNTIPAGTGFYKNDLFYISQLSGFENLASYTSDISSFDFPPYNDILNNEFVNFNSLYFAPTATLSGVLVDPVSPFTLNINFNLNNLSLSSDFMPGGYLNLNYYPFLSSQINSSTFPRSEFANAPGWYFGSGGATPVYKCIRNNNSQRFFPVTLFNILCALSDYYYLATNQYNIGAGVFADNFQVRTSLDNSIDNTDLLQERIVKSSYAKLTGNYHANNPVLSNFYVDYVALTGFIYQPLSLSSSNGDICIWKLDPEYLDNIITIFDIPSSFYTQSSILLSEYPSYIPADTTLWLDMSASVVHSLTSLVVPANILSLSSFYDINSEQFSYYFEIDVPKYNFVGADFYNEMSVFGINHPLTAQGNYTDEYYYQYPYTIIPSSWNIMSYWSSVSTLPVSGSQFYSITSTPFVIGSTNYAFLSTDYSMTHNLALTSAQNLFSGLVNVDILNKSIIKRRNNKILPFSLAVYGMTRPNIYFSSCVLEGGKDPYLGHPWQKSVYLVRDPISAFQLDYPYMSGAWNNKIYKLHNYFSNFTNFLPGTGVNNVDHFDLQTNVPLVTTINTISLQPLVIDKGAAPYLYSSFRKNYSNYENALIYTNYFNVPVLSSLNNLLDQNSLDLYIYTGLSGTNFSTSLTSHEIQFDSNGGCIQVGENSIPTSLYCDPEKIFNTDNSIDYTLSSYKICLSASSIVDSNLQTSYENYFEPASSFGDNIFSYITDKFLTDIEISRTNNNSLTGEEYVYFVNTLYFYVSTPTLFEWKYFYGDIFPSDTYLLTKYGYNLNNTIIVLSGSYFTPVEYDNYNAVTFLNIPFTFNKVNILASKRRTRSLIDSINMAFSAFDVQSPLTLPPYPR